MNFYPPCPFEADLPFFLQIVAKHLEEDPEYLNDLDCPYKERTRDVLSLLIPKTSVQERIEEVQAADPDEDRWEFLDREVQELFKELKKQAEVLGNSTSSEKMSYFRTATSLLEKLVSLQERTVGLKRIAEFHSSVMEIMEDVLTPDQRTKIMEKLERAING